MNNLSKIINLSESCSLSEKYHTLSRTNNFQDLWKYKSLLEEKDLASIPISHSTPPNSQKCPYIKH